MEQGKRRRDEEEEGGGAGGGVDRATALAGATSAVLQLARKAQSDALQVLGGCPSDAFEGVVGSSWPQAYVEGPGAPPFLVVFKGLLPKLLGPALRENMSGAELLSCLESWDSSTVSPDTASLLAKFAEAHEEDQYFQPGPHLGGDIENALFEWADAAITIVTV